MTLRLARPSWIAMVLTATILPNGLTAEPCLTSSAGNDSNTPCCSSRPDCCAATMTSLSVSDRSNWPKIIVEAETLKDKSHCPIQFASNMTRRADHLPKFNDSVEPQLEQALGDAKAENYSKANVTALIVQPGAFALDITLIPLKTLRGVIKATKKPTAVVEPATAYATDQPSTCP